MTSVAYGIALPASRGVIARPIPPWLPWRAGKPASPFFDFANGRYWLNGKQWTTSEHASGILAALSGSAAAASRARVTAAKTVEFVTGLRFDYGQLGALPTLLYEPSVTNAMKYSQAPSHWTGDTGGGIAESDNAAAAPDATMTAASLIPSAASGLKWFGQSLSGALTPGQAAVWSCYVKPFGYAWFYLNAYCDGANHQTWFDLAGGTVGSNATGNTALVQSLANGWHRVSLARAVASSPDSYFECAPTPADGVDSFAGDGVSGAYLWGAQVGVSPAVSSYIPTTNAAATRAADALSMTLPAGVAQAVVTFDDDSAQTLGVSPGGWTLPTKLSRPTIKSLAVF